MNYEVTERSGKLSVRQVNRKRNIRIERTFGEKYNIQNINERIINTQAIRVPFPEVRTLNKRYKLKGKQKLNKRKKAKGIRALYLHYCYLLKIFPKTKQVISKSLREDIKKMDRLSNEAKFLSSNNIQTTQELFNFKEVSIIKKKELKSKREYLWRKYNRAKNDDEKQELYEEIKKIANEIDSLNKEQKMIEDIEARIPNIKEKLKELQETDKNKIKNKENGKEQEDERIK